MILRRLFSKKDELNWGDKFAIDSNKLDLRAMRRLRLKADEGDTDAKNKLSLAMAGYGAAGGLAGGLIGHKLTGGSIKSVGHAAKVAAPWAIAMGLASGVGTRLGHALRSRGAKKSEKFRKRVERQDDQIRVSLGEMTKKEFKNKWYNKD